MLPLITVILIVIALILLLAYLQVRVWLYPPTIPILPQPADSPFSKVTFAGEDRLTISAWYAPPASGRAVLLLHGHGGNRDQLLAHAEYLVAAGYGALLIDFRNHGESEGSFTSMGYHEIKDARAAYRFLQARPQVEQIAIWGHSMGGAVACQLMSEVHADGLLVDAPFADFPSIVYAGVAERGYPAAAVTKLLTGLYGILSQADWNAVRPIDQLAAVDKAVLLLHGSDDPVIPLSEAERIAGANPLIRLSVYEGGKHSDLYELDPARYRSEALTYLEQAFSSKSGA